MRWSQRLAAAKSSFEFMKQFVVFATLGSASRGSACSRYAHCRHSMKPPFPAVFTPDDEPYLGRKPLFVLDKAISGCMATCRRAANGLHAHDGSATQTMAAQVIPQSISIFLALRELIRQ